MKTACVMIRVVFGIIVLFFYAGSATSAITDSASLQRGARTFMNYCATCHSLRYLHYSQMAEGIGLTTSSGVLDKPLLVHNLLFTGAAVDDPIISAMPKGDAKAWFGVSPPDLSLIARQRGKDWLYAWLSGFYEDNSRPFGSNNRLTPFLAMPDVLSHLKYGPDKLSPSEWDQLLQDLVTFLAYVAQPEQDVRYRLGCYVLMFLSVLIWLVWQLKKNYWRNR